MSLIEHAYVIERRSMLYEGKESYFPVRVFFDREKAYNFTKEINDFLRDRRKKSIAPEIPEKFKDCIDDFSDVFISDVFILTEVRIGQ